ncbi:uncharacterized protein [Aristolochia californica]|uniref:uncharacterized protein isoform X1 n=1 Tax=Aristolochia californica TaxID=171875 RepID=UPI0035D73218
MASQTQQKSKSAKSMPFLRLKYNSAISPGPLNSSATSPPSSSSSCPPSGLTRHKSALSSLFSVTFANNPPALAAAASSKKMHFKSATFRGLGCASAAEVSTPENLVRSSADWQAKRIRKKKQRNGRKKQSSGNNNMVFLPDVWCAPGIGFATDATSVDCVVARRNPNASGTGRGRANGDRNIGERSCIARHNIHNLEQIYDQDTTSSIQVHCPGSDVVRSGHHPLFRGLHRPPGGLAEVMMFQTSFLSGILDHFDKYRDLRLDVDNMSYEELLELGDRIGYVSTGLRDEEILLCLRKMKHSILSNAPSHITTGIDRKCSICQEEYEANDEVGELECGHSYHLNCIKQWLLQKNACPICKVVAAQ